MNTPSPLANNKYQLKGLLFEMLSYRLNNNLDFIIPFTDKETEGQKS